MNDIIKPGLFALVLALVGVEVWLLAESAATRSYGGQSAVLAILALAALAATSVTGRSFFDFVARLSIICATLLLVIGWTWTMHQGAETMDAFAAAFASFSAWPVIIGALAGGRAFALMTERLRGPEGDGKLSALALFLYSLGIGLAALSLFAAFARAVGTDLFAHLTSTPVHLAIYMLFVYILVILLATRWQVFEQEREIADTAFDAGADGLAVLPYYALDRGLRRFVRTLIGFLPLLGFLGTVLGIMQALGALPAGLDANGATADAALAGGLQESLAGIAVAFETTLLGLLGNLTASLLLAATEKAEADLIDRTPAAAGGVPPRIEQ